MRILLSVAVVLLPAVATAQDMPLHEILKDGETWKKVTDSFGTVGGLSWDRTLKKLNVFDQNGAPVGYLSEEGKRVDGRPEFHLAKASQVFPGELDDRVYELKKGKLMVRRAKEAEVREVKIPLKEPTALIGWLDDSHVVIADAADKWMWAFRVQKDGTLGPGDRYYSLFVRRGEMRSDVTELEIDNRHRVYAASKEGIQVFDPTGRLSGVFLKAANSPVTAMSFAGESGNVFFVAHGKEIYYRKMTAQGFFIPFKK